MSAGSRDDPPPRSPLWSRTAYDRYLEWALEAGTTPNGVFGAKLMWGYFGDFVSLLRNVPRYRDLSLAELLPEVFPNLTFVRVVRANKVRQAVSLWKAVQTARWRQAQERDRDAVSVDDGDTPPYKAFIEEHRPQLRFHYRAIEHLLGRILVEEACWDAFFEHSGTRPLLVLYENFAADPEVSTLERPQAPGAVAARRTSASKLHMKRQSDQLNDDWARRYSEIKLGTEFDLSAGCAGGCMSAPGRDNERPPNILYIHSHDTGRYVQPYGYQVPTPNIQLLADQGVLFRNAFCAAPTCSGSRASLLTGQYCHNNGMLGLAHRGWSLNDYGQHLVHPLRSAGYYSALIGEQHISRDTGVIGYDDVVELDSNHAGDVAPIAIATMQRLPAAVLPLGRVLRDSPEVRGADLGARHPLLAAATEPSGHPANAARTWPHSRPARAHWTRASERC